MDIILPNRSLMIVDKGWLKEKTPSELASVSSSKKHRVDGRKSTIDDIAITVMENASGKGAGSKELPKASQDDRKRSIPPKPTKNLRFVNATAPAHNREPEVRKLVRSHVRKGSGRSEVRKGPRKKADSPLATLSKVQEGQDIESGELLVFPKMSPVLSGSTTPFYGGINFAIQPRYYRLMNCYLDHVSRVLYPWDSLLTFNPARDEWFPLAITDEVLLHTTLLAAATHISIASGCKSSKEPDLLTERVLRQLNRRLANHAELSDTTLGAIACLAMLENMQGNHTKWKIHMKGMAEIIRIRGGISATDLVLQMKLCRADIEGAVDSVSEPQLNPPTRLHLPIYLTLPASEPSVQNNDLLAMLISASVGSHLVAIYHDLSRFSYALQYALSSPAVLLHPRSLDEDVILVQYELLKSQGTDESELEKALRLGALMYVKSVSRSTPLSPRSSAKLTRKLRSVLGDLTVGSSPRLLLVWLCFVGGCASRCPNRAWFIEKLVDSLAFQGEVWTWEDAKAALQKVLWVEHIHEEMYRHLWNEI